MLGKDVLSDSDILILFLLLVFYIFIWYFCCKNETKVGVELYKQ